MPLGTLTLPLSQNCLALALQQRRFTPGVTHMKSFLLSAVLGFLLVTAAQAKSDKAAPKQATSPTPAVASPSAPSVVQPWLQLEITPLEKEIVKQHLVDIRAAQSKKSAPGKALPPGLAKKVARGEKLPPGWQKKIARGEVIPQTVYAQAQPLPAVVIRTLPPPPAGTILVTLDGKLVRLLEATRTIVDVFELK